MKQSHRPVYDLGAAFPDPAARGTTIAYSLARDDEVDLAVFDPGGRLVRRLVGGRVQQGARTATWDGTDRLGRRVPAGLYLYRLRTPNFTRTRRLTIVR
jgi:flagellar hook assembly protein FlgD